MVWGLIGLVGSLTERENFQRFMMDDLDYINHDRYWYLQTPNIDSKRSRTNFHTTLPWIRKSILKNISSKTIINNWTLACEKGGYSLRDCSVNWTRNFQYQQSKTIKQ
jgi:hypothetical protein